MPAKVGYKAKCACVVHGNIYSIMRLNAPANHGLARTGKPPQLVNMFPHYLVKSEIPMESTHHIIQHATASENKL